MYAAAAAVIAAVVVSVDTAFIIATVVLTAMARYTHNTSTSSGYVYTVTASIDIIIHVTNIIHAIMRVTLVDFIIIILIYTFRCFLTRGVEACPAVALI